MLDYQRVIWPKWKVIQPAKVMSSTGSSNTKKEMLINNHGHQTSLYWGILGDEWHGSQTCVISPSRYTTFQTSKSIQIRFCGLLQRFRALPFGTLPGKWKCHAHTGVDSSTHVDKFGIFFCNVCFPSVPSTKTSGPLHMIKATIAETGHGTAKHVELPSGKLT